MNKNEFIEAMAARTGGSKADAGRAARTGRNPKTGEVLKIAASRVPAFKPGAALKAAVNWTGKK